VQQEPPLGPEIRDRVEIRIARLRLRQELRHARIEREMRGMKKLDAGEQHWRNHQAQKGQRALRRYRHRLSLYSALAAFVTSRV
jgi:hypothetical protein